MTPERIAFAKEAVEAFLDNERDKNAEEGLAYEVAQTLLSEIEAGGDGCLIGLPALKLAILNYCIEQEEQAQSDREAEKDETKEIQ